MLGGTGKEQLGGAETRERTSSMLAPLSQQEEDHPTQVFCAHLRTVLISVANILAANYRLPWCLGCIPVLGPLLASQVVYGLAVLIVDLSVVALFYHAYIPVLAFPVITTAVPALAILTGGCDMEDTMFHLFVMALMWLTVCSPKEHARLKYRFSGVYGRSLSAVLHWLPDFKVTWIAPPALSKKD